MVIGAAERTAVALRVLLWSLWSPCERCGGTVVGVVPLYCGGTVVRHVVSVVALGPYCGRTVVVLWSSYGHCRHCGGTVIIVSVSVVVLWWRKLRTLKNKMTFAKR